ncbi:Tetratricopeptide repeat-containing protein [Evansella caseinilytica]|uniref:Tetratricopeptide repeat-containing protein n=1 Tax=Evansella caseinilytica TaxID=1503961 RepID=A0A1H3PY18_9BACI|nr:tetratricopeptide repeat protein [Evansella caseinilytica]SDZ05279.1 Tetratricopeptide repeat-containing protein [Evansella caseinilytica]
MGKQEEGKDDNIILFPGLVSRLVEKGMSSLKEKKYYEALGFFQESIELEPSHPQARYGLVITNIEMERLEEAKKHCESMLREGIGQYFEVLQVYVSLLVQLGDYKEVEMLLETVMSEAKLPAEMAESFYQLLEFSRQMTSHHMDYSDEEASEENMEAFAGKIEEWIRLLERGEIDQQWGALQKLSQQNTEEVKKAYRTFLKGTDNNPVLKSYLLQMLKEMQVKDTFEVHKFGETFHVNIEELEDVFHERFGAAVIERLEQELGQESPSLFEMVQQVWWHYLFALYPKSPKPLDAPVWAAALHILGLSLLDDASQPDDVCGKYHVKEQDAFTAVEHIKGIETHIFKD